MNGLQVKKRSVVKLSRKRGSVIATAKGGAAFTEAFATRTGLWSDARRELPARRDPRQGFTTATWLVALVHGVLCGGRGFCATEPMRDDEPLLAILGLERAPSAETVEEVAKYLAEPATQGHAALSRVLARQCLRLLGKETRAALLHRGFVPVWGDGSLLETQGKTKDALVCIKGAWGQVASAIFVGPYAAACDFSRPVEGAAKSEGELIATRRLLPQAFAVLKRTRLEAKTLFLFDSLYGEDTTLTMLEGVAGARHIVGANTLKRTQAVLEEQPASQWTDTTAATAGRNWEESAVCEASIECEGWERKRTLVGRRWRKEGEAIWNYSGVITNLDAKDPRVAAIMKDGKLCFAEAVWSLYDHKQALENRWKDVLRDMGLHTAPCGKAAVNGVFLAAAAIAVNLKTGCLRLCMGNAPMALWRFRRDVIDLPAAVARHARQVVVTLLDARERLCRELDVGFAKLAAL